ncbi:MAG: hypothetical protein Q8L59_09055 [Phenylobacterium sp.]|uniref:hypothetical protein n=1 Tax=Phenylobacterium sp. TaxID=1871053 RepID=UPI00273708F3|nr:hypothetical protein [Phenylobacterium sp.]MDP1642318.1 hypothetical protein [Phenylobacterium sp.]MDP3118423.1 hypothetical protein [Phenylobacterium sp.]
MATWFPAAGLCFLSLIAALVLGAAPRQANAAAAIFPPWWDAPRALAAADRAGAVTGIGAQPFIITLTERAPSDATNRSLAAALRAQGAWLVVDPGLAGPCAPPR